MPGDATDVELAWTVNKIGHFLEKTVLLKIPTLACPVHHIKSGLKIDWIGGSR